MAGRISTVVGVCVFQIYSYDIFEAAVSPRAASFIPVCCAAYAQLKLKQLLGVELNVLQGIVRRSKKIGIVVLQLVSEQRAMDTHTYTHPLPNVLCTVCSVLFIVGKLERKVHCGASCSRIYVIINYIKCIAKQVPVSFVFFFSHATM